MTKIIIEIPDEEAYDVKEWLELSGFEPEVVNE